MLITHKITNNLNEVVTIKLNSNALNQPNYMACFKLLLKSNSILNESKEDIKKAVAECFSSNIRGGFLESKFSKKTYGHVK